MEIIEKIDKEVQALEKSTAASIRESFFPVLQQIEKWDNYSKTIVVTDESQKREMSAAREGRLAVKELRVNSDKLRKKLKEDSLAYGKAVQGVYNIIEALLKPIEARLFEQENFVVLKKQKELDDRYQERLKELTPYEGYYGTLFPHVKEMSDGEFVSYVESCKGRKGAYEQEQERIKREAEEMAARRMLNDERVESLADLMAGCRFFGIPIHSMNELWKYSDVEIEELFKVWNKKKDDQAKEIARQEAEAEAKRKELEAKAKEAAKRADAERKAREEAERKAKAERLAAEQKAKAEREALEKQRKEQEERLRKVEAEKAAAEAAAMKAEADRMAIIAKREADAKAEAERIAAMGDADRIKAIAQGLVAFKDGIDLSQFKADSSKVLVKNTIVLIEKVVKYIDDNRSEVVKTS